MLGIASATVCGGGNAVATAWTCQWTITTTSAGPITVNFIPTPVTTKDGITVTNATSKVVVGSPQGSGTLNYVTPSLPPGTYTILVSDTSKVTATFALTISHY